ncbi:MAG: NlpC/P60 family protein [Sulfitobacter sp.]
MTQQTPKQITAPIADLMRRPDGPRDRQLIFGDTVTDLGIDGQWHYVQAAKDGYCGYLQSQFLGPVQPATHIVHAPATHAYRAADFKSPNQCGLTFSSRVTALSETGKYVETSLGFIPKQHLSPANRLFSDPASVAAFFLGTPYLWGGNSRWGIDCSGLVQTALLACGIPCPGDSHMQETLGQAATGTFKRNDLLFWKGHVALVSDPQTLIHANAGAMACVYEPILDAIARIQSQGDGPLTAHRRL